MSQIIIKNLKFYVGKREIIVGTNMSAYLAQQLSFRLKEDFGIECEYKVQEEKDDEPNNKEN